MNGINKPLTKRGQKTFDALINSAITLFHTKGYHQTTIAEIASEASVSVGTFYIYFTDKYSLYNHVLKELGHKIRAHTTKAILQSKTRREAERAGIKAFIKYIRDYPHVYTVIWQALQVDKTLFINYYTDFAARYTKGLNEAFKKGEVLETNFQTLSYALMGISNFVGLQVTMLEPNLKSDETIDHLVDNLFDTLEKGLFVKER
ncbi:MAG: TetR/AcrR family transcriptional regulator [Bacilli bacterium]|jgi:AcrR family transcriptional regulator|nr:TetR/AcrR family transcriptional regulator [Bacilli bacterium]